MLNDILHAVTVRLDETFNHTDNAVAIYTDSVKQGLTKPCFFVSFIRTSMKQVIGRRYYSSNPLSVQYIPVEEEETEHLYEIAETLTEELEWIQLKNGDLLHGTSMERYVEDGVLTFLVDYNLYMYRKGTAEDMMEELEIEKGKVK